MWILLNDGFLSVVDKSMRNNHLLVRSRCREHLLAVFPKADVRESFNTDYRFRADIPRAEVAQVIAERISDIDYKNFKDSVKDRPLHDAYMACWNVLGRLQKWGPYGQDRARRGQRDFFGTDRDPFGGNEFG